MTSCIYVLDNHLGGIASLCSNLIRHRPPDALPQAALLVTNRSDPVARVKESLGADREALFEYSDCDNVYTVLRNFSRALPAEPGPLVSNSATELAAFGLHAPRQTVFQIVHDAYNLRLAQRYEPVVDAMIAHSRHFHQALLDAFPHRAESIFYLPYGIRLAPRTRSPASGPLRLVFLGRMAVGKGVHDLPLIDAELAKLGTAVTWTLIGDGPERTALQQKLPPSDRVHYAAPPTNAEVLALCTGADVFVLPTRFEGFPVALLEAMSTGLVPVVTDLPSGIPELVDASTGFRIAMGDVAAFAAAIAKLASNRAMLEAMSRAARRRSEDFEVTAKAAGYHALFARWRELKRAWGGPLAIKHGSRLDRPYLPNAWVRGVRTAVRKWKHLRSAARVS